MIYLWKGCFISVLFLFSFTVSAGDTQLAQPVPQAEYVVQRGDILGEISIRLYGTSRLWKKIAKWNHLEDPDHILEGDKLILMKPPKLTAEEGDKAVATMRKKRDEKMFSANEPSRALSAVPTAEVPIPEEKPPQAFVEDLRLSKEEEKKNLSQPELTAQEAYEQGEQDFSKKDYEESALMFHKSRTLNPDSLPSWFFEIRALKMKTEGEEEAKSVAHEFIKEHPELIELPMFQTLLKPTE